MKNRYYELLEIRRMFNQKKMWESRIGTPTNPAPYWAAKISNGVNHVWRTTKLKIISACGEVIISKFNPDPVKNSNRKCKRCMKTMENVEKYKKYFAEHLQLDKFLIVQEERRKGEK
jgi:hypothetical protein